MRTAWPLVFSVYLSACAPAHLALRPTAPLPSGDGLVVGRLLVDGFAPDRWDDAFETGYGQRLLLVQFRDRKGVRHVAPCRQDGLFGCVLGNGPLTLDSVTLTTPHGSWITLIPSRPVVADPAGGLDMGTLQLSVPLHDLGRWQALRQTSGVRFQRATLRVDVALGPDPVTAQALQGWSAGHWTWGTHPLTQRQAVYQRFDALRLRLGL